MKKLGKISAFALVQIAAMSAAGAASAAGSFSFPSGQVIYNFNTPSVSIYGAIQIGGTPTTNVTQGSVNNIAVVGQVGTTPTTKIVQTGTLNVAHVTQIGHTNNALTIQFGNIESLLANN
ncbi:MAG: hypothetical protein AB1508_14935 [Pseudomonadota bacterium]